MKAPPLLVSYSDVGQYLSALSEREIAQYGHEIESLVQRNLPPVVTVQCLATLFGYSTKFVMAMYSQSWRYYRRFEIRKGTKQRTITAPKVALKVIQKWLAHHLSVELAFNKNVYGFVPNLSAIDAAAAHCGARWVYTVDIENFFSSTPQNLVYEALQRVGYSERAADLLAALCCFKGYLSQGAPSSPALSNLVFAPLDEELSAYASQHGLSYTRYADDIVLSGKSEVVTGLREYVKGLIERNGWHVSEKKEKLYIRPHGLKVHGLIISGKSPRLTKAYRNRIRAYRHLIKKLQVREEDRARLLGHIAYAESIEGYAMRNSAIGEE